jgi:hypothetical protein
VCFILGNVPLGLDQTSLEQISSFGISHVGCLRFWSWESRYSARQALANAAMAASRVGA